MPRILQLIHVIEELDILTILYCAIFLMIFVILIELFQCICLILYTRFVCVYVDKVILISKNIQIVIRLIFDKNKYLYIK